MKDHLVWAGIWGALPIGNAHILTVSTLHPKPYLLYPPVFTCPSAFMSGLPTLLPSRGFVGAMRVLWDNGKENGNYDIIIWYSRVYLRVI